MRVSSATAFKEWAIVVDALGKGEQTIILRKGGLHEKRGEFQVEHRQFWLFPTQFHEAEPAIIPSKRPALRELAAQVKPDVADIQYFAVADTIIPITDPLLLPRLQGRHIWSQHILHQRFEFGRQPGLHLLILRLYRLAVPTPVPVRDTYGGCKSWIQLEAPLAGEVAPVLEDSEFQLQRDQLTDLLNDHASSRL
jgi:hypothetical protein